MYNTLNADLQNTINRYIAEAKLLGLNAINAIKLTVLGNSELTFYSEQRYLIISYAAPQQSPTDAILWINPTNRIMFKQDFANNSWIRVKNIKQMFNDSDLDSPQGSSTVGGQPVQSTSDLVQLSTENLPDKTVIYVENDRTLYAYDQDSEEPADGTTVLVPTSGSGRWFAISNASGTITNIDGGMF